MTIVKKTVNSLKNTYVQLYEHNNFPQFLAYILLL